MNYKKQQNKLLKIKLIKTKIYNRNDFFKKLKIQNFESRLKKLFLIVYKYHINNKKIIFICNDLTINFLKNDLLIKNTKHKFISNELFNISMLKKTNLIVVYNETLDSNLVKKIYEIKIPIIFLFKFYFNNNNEYKILGNFIFLKNIKNKNNFLLSLLRTILK